MLPSPFQPLLPLRMTITEMLSVLPRLYAVSRSAIAVSIGPSPRRTTATTTSSLLRKKQSR